MSPIMTFGISYLRVLLYRSEPPFQHVAVGQDTFLYLNLLDLYIRKFVSATEHILNIGVLRPPAYRLHHSPLNGFRSFDYGNSQPTSPSF